MSVMTVVRDTLDALDTMEEAPTDGEVAVLETVTRQCRHGRLPSVAQYRILCDLVEHYLDAPALLRALKLAAPRILAGDALR